MKLINADRSFEFKGAVMSHYGIHGSKYFDVESILKMINEPADISDTFTAYNETDWIDGLDEDMQVIAFIKKTIPANQIRRDIKVNLDDIVLKCIEMGWEEEDEPTFTFVDALNNLYGLECSVFEEIKAIKKMKEPNVKNS